VKEKEREEVAGGKLTMQQNAVFNDGLKRGGQTPFLEREIQVGENL